ncbi:ribosome maturation factor RimM [Chromobacterium subtsugae]|uniref:Ribosome maturation factor RimM n=1 Tax=Chromobacterium subtsugae TaxID=251747 RepID=A0ABS7FDT4_9NEIS|nr:MULTISPECIES: ribosome maturation factor RimM [Chromobacterium]KUM03653.1 ribosome maturation factor RimM [Chromobacterium subtsugae]KZE86913.1 ribosome maturation factor RimM [Chromobacterium sp. F49]MBW7566826.1 ribosome maturation factor RimM [Chromobacterium subtsugae]MBW8288131.1 ribosome maturation factor RimM [Chromobacterium subtsugae]OBU86547.1 ribosome maturation factor RimM [Chromobacterium subtsugae]
MRDEDLVVMGFVRGAFGIKGWVKIHADTEHADGLFDYPVWWLGKDGSWKPHAFENGTIQPKALAAKLEGVEDRDGAEALRGMQIAVPRSELPEAGEGEYYWSDLIGLAVVNQQGETLGAVDSLMETGANDVLVVKGEHGQRLIPFVDQYVLEVMPAEGRILVDWGLDY